MSATTSPRSFGLGACAAAAAGVAGALVWVLVAVGTKHSFGILATGLGALVGLAAGKLGRVEDKQSLPIVSGVVALLAVGVGDVLAWCAVSSHELAKAEIHLSTMTLFRGMITGSVDVLGVELHPREGYKEDFNGILVLFAVLGVAAAYRLCLQLLESEAAKQKAPSFPPPSGPAAGAPGWGAPGWGAAGAAPGSPAPGSPAPGYPAPGYGAPVPPGAVDYFGKPVPPTGH